MHLINGFLHCGHGAARGAMPAGSTEDWTVDAARELALTNDQMQAATWTLPAGLTPGATFATATRTTIMITAPSASPRPFRVRMVYTTAQGRTVPVEFEVLVADPVRFS